MVLVVFCGTRHHLMSCGFLVGDMSGFPRKAGKWVGVWWCCPPAATHGTETSYHYIWVLRYTRCFYYDNYPPDRGFNPWLPWSARVLLTRAHLDWTMACIMVRHDW